MKIFLLVPKFNKNGDTVYRNVFQSESLVWWLIKMRDGREATKNAYRQFKIQWMGDGGKMPSDFFSSFYSIKAIAALRHMLEESGDLFDVDCSDVGAEYMYYKCWNKLDVIDVPSSDLSGPRGVVKAVFKSNSALPDYFTTPNFSHPLVSEKFKQAAEYAGLVGMDFIEVGSNEQ